MDSHQSFLGTSGALGLLGEGCGSHQVLQGPILEQVGPLFGSGSWGREQVHTTMFVLGQGHQGLGPSCWVEMCVGERAGPGRQEQAAVRGADVNSAAALPSTLTNHSPGLFPTFLGS